ncbi:MAG TPA: hypothetical protein VGF60_05455 [Xanthobacteraceae bacterium]|jgi:hypothetical protein
MRGLVPRIHVFYDVAQGMDGRDKPGQALIVNIATRATGSLLRKS